MDTTSKLILDVVDDDIADHFAELEDGTYMTMLPIAIHLSRHLARISAFICSDNRRDSSDRSSDGQGNV